MRGSLKGVLSRVDRLAERLRPSPKDWAAKIKTMSNEELYWEIMEFAREAGGPDALFTQAGLDREQYPTVLRDLRAHWERTGER